MPTSWRITPGRLLAIEALLRLAATHGEIEDSNAGAVLRTSGALGGSSPWGDSIDMAVASGLVTCAAGRLSIADDAEQLAALVRARLTVPVRRRILRTLVNELRPDLLVIAFMDEPAIRAFVDPDTVQCLVELGLFANDPDANEWWDCLKDSATVADRDYLKRLGDLAEERSLMYESKRLRSEGFTDLSESVRWVSRVDDTLGYDIQSFAGVDFDSLDATAPLRIEVKACGHTGGRLRFFLTRNEWSVGLQNPDSWIVHFWRSSDLGRPYVDEPYAIVAVDQLRHHVPIDVSDLARWTVCEVVLPE